MFISFRGWRQNQWIDKCLPNLCLGAYLYGDGCRFSPSVVPKNYFVSFLPRSVYCFVIDKCYIYACILISASKPSWFQVTTSFTPETWVGSCTVSGGVWLKSLEMMTIQWLPHWGLGLTLARWEKISSPSYLCTIRVVALSCLFSYIYIYVRSRHSRAHSIAGLHVNFFSAFVSNCVIQYSDLQW